MATTDFVSVAEHLLILQRARNRDNFVREFERQWADWTEIARCCVEVDRDRDWEVLGFHSFESWLCDAAPRSRSYLYLVMGRYKELSVDIPPEELAQIPLGSAGVLKQLSSKIRRSPEVIDAAKKTPKEFREALQESHPEQLIEQIVTVKLKFSVSQWERIEGAYEAYKLVDPTASLTTFLEYCVSWLPE
jgi:hypothetical protein